MKLKLREILYIAFFACIWGLFELSVGNLLHTLCIPFCGVILSCIGALILITSRRFVKFKGSIIIIGFITAFLKFTLMGSFKIFPAIGICIESLIIEIGLLFFKENFFSYLIITQLAVFWCFVQPYIYTVVLSIQNDSAFYKSIFKNFDPKKPLSSVLFYYFTANFIISFVFAIPTTYTTIAISKRLQKIMTDPIIL